MKTVFRILIILLALNIPAHAQTEAQRKKQYNLEHGVAIQGYDPVSYFSGKPKKGSKNITAIYKGVEYHFSTAVNRDKFNKAPEKYEPQYGGWCAYAMATNGDKVEIDPESYIIYDGKLFLFYNSFFNDTRDKWKDMNGNKELKPKADANWRKYVP